MFKNLYLPIILCLFFSLSWSQDNEKGWRDAFIDSKSNNAMEPIGDLLKKAKFLEVTYRCIGLSRFASIIIKETYLIPEEREPLDSEDELKIKKYDEQFSWFLGSAGRMYADLSQDPNITEDQFMDVAIPKIELIVDNYSKEMALSVMAKQQSILIQEDLKLCEILLEDDDN